MKLFNSLRYRLFITTGLILSLGACASLSPDWQLQKQQDGIDYFTRQSQHASLPEFKAHIQVNASIPKVMELVTDFSRHPEWVYRCDKIQVIATGSSRDPGSTAPTQPSVFQDPSPASSGKESVLAGAG
jgi:hypothetical protein